eukprot:10165457-Heterocapsa_arctica.AAC.1
MELKDMPDIINEMESDLRNFNTESFKHKIRGQHPDRGNPLGDPEENDVMGEIEEHMTDWSVADIMNAWQTSGR